MRGVLWLLVLYALAGLASFLLFAAVKTVQSVGRRLGRRTEQER
jgi:hypothetical protein